MNILGRIKSLRRSQWLHYFVLGLSALVLFLPNILSFLPSAFFHDEWKLAKFFLNIGYFQKMSDVIASASDSYSRERYYCYLSIVQVILPIQLLLAIYAASVRDKNYPKPFFESFQRLFWLNFLWIVLIANNIFLNEFEEMALKRYGRVFTFNQGSIVIFVLSISLSSMFYRVASIIRDFIIEKHLKN